MQTHIIYCATCGAANEDSATTCLACQHPFDVLPGDTILLDGRYRLLRQIGAGGFGAVYLANDSQNPNARIAIKQINLHGLSTRQMIEATETFERERAILAPLNHPQLPRIYETFETAESWYLVMDYFAGETLERYLSTHEQSIHAGQPNERIEDALCLGVQLCNVLDYLHTRIPPIIFRDLKPSNIIRQSQKSYALVDFGIARYFKPAQARDTIPFGSPGYAAPEQYGRAQTDSRADIYSLGAILHQMLSGHDPTDQPFHFAPLLFTGPTLKRLESLIMRMVALQAERRPATIGDVAEELRAIQQARQETDVRIWTPGPGLPPPQPTEMTLLPPGSRSGKPWQPRKAITRRNVLISGLTAGVAVALFGAGMYARQTFGSLSNPPSRALDLRLKEARISQLSWSPESTYLAISMEDAVRIWNIHSQKLVWVLPTMGRNTAVTWSPDGQHLALNAGTHIQVLQRGTWKPLLSWEDPVNWDSPHDPFASMYLAWSPNGKYLAQANNGGPLHIWNPLTGQLVRSYSQDTLNWFAWSPDSSMLATGRDTINIWDLRTGHMLLQRKYDPSQIIFIPPLVAWSPDSKQLAFPILVNGKYSIQIVNSFTGDAIKTSTSISSSGNNALGNVTWSPDGRYIAANYTNNSTGTVTHTIKFWDARSGALVQTYDSGDPPAVEIWYPDTLIWSPDGKYVITTFQDRTNLQDQEFVSYIWAFNAPSHGSLG